MTPNLLAQKRGLAAYALLAMVVAVLLSGAMFQLPAPPPDDGVDINAGLSQQQVELARGDELKQAYLKLKRTYAGKEPEDNPSAAALPETDWTLQGVLAEGGRMYALINHGDETRRYSAGDTLPDGSTVNEVTGRGISVTTTAEEQRSYPLYSARAKQD